MKEIIALKLRSWRGSFVHKMGAALFLSPKVVFVLCKGGVNKMAENNKRRL